jgi:hypothetical protein
MQSCGKAVVAYFDLTLALTTVALYFMYYNLRPRASDARVIPAMEAGLADHVWAIEGIVGLLW